MKLNEFFSYKTQFIFAKNEINHEFYKDITDQELNIPNIKDVSIDDLSKLYYQKPHLLVVLKTKYGSFIKCDFKDDEYLRDFITKNSEIFCAAFTSHRVSDSYTFGFAEKGEIKRYFSVEEGEVINEGLESIYEKDVEHKLKEPTEEELISYVDESDIMSIIKNCVGFDIEEEDVEILDCRVYEWSGTEPNVPKDIVPKIFENLAKYNIKSASIQFGKSRKSKNIIIIASVNMDDNEHFIYSFMCKKKFTYENFLEGYHSAMYCLSNFKFPESFMEYGKNEDSKLFLDVRLFKTLNLKMDTMVSCFFRPVDNKDVYIYLTKIGEKYTDERRSKCNADILENYNPDNDDKLVYKFIKKNINRRFFRFYGHWNLQASTKSFF